VVVIPAERSGGRRGGYWRRAGAGKDAGIGGNRVSKVWMVEHVKDLAAQHQTLAFAILNCRETPVLKLRLPAPQACCGLSCQTILPRR